jgi:hypothetical protein
MAAPTHTTFLSIVSVSVTQAVWHGVRLAWPWGVRCAAPLRCRLVLGPCARACMAGSWQYVCSGCTAPPPPDPSVPAAPPTMHAHHAPATRAGLHPQRLRTEMCQFGASCNRPICFFAHGLSDLRVRVCARACVRLCVMVVLLPAMCKSAQAACPAAECVTHCCCCCRCHHHTRVTHTSHTRHTHVMHITPASLE